MMANMPIFQDMAAALLNGTVKPAAAAEGEGVDFAALLAGVETSVGTGTGTDRGDAPGQAEAAAKRPDFVNAMLFIEQPSGTKTLPEGAALPVSDRPAKPSMPAKFVQMASALPQVAMALKAEAAVPVTVDPVTSEGDDAEQGEKSANKINASVIQTLPPAAMTMETEAAVPIKAKPVASEDRDAKLVDEGADKAKAPVMQGLALPLLQGLDLPAADGQPVASAKDAKAQPVANPSAGGVKIPGILPPWAAQPAQIHAQAGKQDNMSSLEPGAQSAGGRSAAAPPTNSRQALALEFAAASLGKDASSETVPASAVSKAEKPGEAAVLVPAPAPIAGVPTAGAEMSGVSEVAAPIAAGIAAVDTGAMLGEQVIDMGVDGQWIDRMAREIADISAGTGRASFTLNPENLGRLQVEILQRDEGADVRLIAETDEAATALSQGRQQLQQDARLQAVRIHDVQVERAPVERSQPDAGIFARGNASAQDMAGQQGQSQSFHKKPLMEAVSSKATGQEQDQAASERTRSQRARYA